MLATISKYVKHVGKNSLSTCIS